MKFATDAAALSETSLAVDLKKSRKRIITSIAIALALIASVNIKISYF